MSPSPSYPPSPQPLLHSKPHLSTFPEKYFFASWHYAKTQTSSICTCNTAHNKTYLEPLVICTNTKCRMRYFHIRCVGLEQHPTGGKKWFCAQCESDREPEPRICVPKTNIGATALHQEKKTSRAKPHREEDVPQVEGSEQKQLHLPEKELQQVEITQQQQHEQEETVDDATSRPPPSKRRKTSSLPSRGLTPASFSKSSTTRPKSKSTPKSQHQYPPYCICGTPETQQMIACDEKNCRKGWFHYECVGLTAKTVPAGSWFCEDCVAEKENKGRGKKRKR